MKLYEDSLYIEDVFRHNFSIEDKKEFNRLITESAGSYVIDAAKSIIEELLASIKNQYSSRGEYLYDEIGDCKGNIEDWRAYNYNKKIAVRMTRVPEMRKTAEATIEVMDNVKTNKSFWSKVASVGNKTFSTIFNAILGLISMVTSNMAIRDMDNKEKYGKNYHANNSRQNNDKNFTHLLPVQMIEKLRDNLKHIDFKSLTPKLNFFSKNEKVEEAYIKMMNSVGVDYEYNKRRYYQLLEATEVKPVKEEVITGIAVGAGIVLAVVSLLTISRNIIFMIYLKRTNAAKYLELQADYLKAHEIEIKHNSNFTPAQKEDIISSQRKWRERLLKLADVIKVDDIQASNEAKKKIKSSDNEITLTNIKRKSLSNKVVTSKNAEDDNILQLL